MVCERNQLLWTRQMDGDKKAGEKRLMKGMLDASTIDSILKRRGHNDR